MSGARVVNCLLLLLPGLAFSPWSAAADYRADFDPERSQLAVQACFGAGGPVVLRLDDTAAISDLRDPSGSRRRANRVTLAAGDQRRCLSYSVDLARLQRDSSRRSSSIPSSQQWLYRPRSLAGSELVVNFPSGYGVSLPWPRLQRSATSARYRFDATPADWPNMTAFGALTQYEVELPGGQWRVSVLPGKPAVRHSEVKRWLERTATNLTAVYGRSPLPSTQLLVVPAGRGRGPVPWGQVNRGGSPAVHLVINQTKSYQELVADWTATHEVSHLLLPYLGTGGRWLSEGLASYYQNIARARTDDLSQRAAFEKLHAGFSRGRKNSDDGLTLGAANRAMRQQNKYMRIYWSGAAFWLQADLALREVGQSLDQVLNQFAQCHLPAAERWTPTRLVRRLDQLAGRRVFEPLYQDMVDDRHFPDLGQTYAALGLRPRGSRISLVGGESEQALRDQLTSPSASRTQVACASRAAED